MFQRSQTYTDKYFWVEDITPNKKQRQVIFVNQEKDAIDY